MRQVDYISDLKSILCDDYCAFEDYPRFVNYARYIAFSDCSESHYLTRASGVPAKRRRVAQTCVIVEPWVACATTCKTAKCAQIAEGSKDCGKDFVRIPDRLGQRTDSRCPRKDPIKSTSCGLADADVRRRARRWVADRAISISSSTSRDALTSAASAVKIRAVSNGLAPRARRGMMRPRVSIFHDFGAGASDSRNQTHKNGGESQPFQCGCIVDVMKRRGATAAANAHFPS